jgi:NTE family protein
MSGNNSGFPKNIGLALGSGSARGWAHVGVIRALADAGIEVKA